jgi:hypothetical protein
MLGRALVFAAVILSVAGALGCAAFQPPLTCPARGGAPWTELDAEHFDVETDLDPAEGRAVLADVEGIYATFKDVAFPSDADPHEHLDVVTFSRTRDYESIAPRGSGAFFRARKAGDADATPTIVMSGGLGPKARLTLQHELTHHFVRQILGDAPPWLNEGMAQYYSTLRVEDGKAILGAPLPDLAFTTGGRWGTEQKNVWTVARVPVGAVPSVAQLLVTGPAAFYHNEGGTSLEASRRRLVNYAGAWALVHMLTNGPDAYRARFSAFLDALRAGSGRDQAWANSVGALDPRALEDDFRKYLLLREVRTWTTAYTPRVVEAKIEARAMVDGEVHLLWERLRPGLGHPPPHGATLGRLSSRPGRSRSSRSCSPAARR